MSTVPRSKSDIPLESFKLYCESTKVPIACVAANHYFLWVNSAYEQLVGYAEADLIHKTWMDITVSEDVAADKEAVDHLLEGRGGQYTMAKRYRHRRGNEVPIQLTAWRYPPVGKLLCFMAEAIPDSAAGEEIKGMREEFSSSIAEIRSHIDALEAAQSQRDKIVSHKHDTDTNVFNIGNNDVKVALGVVALIVAALAYYVYIVGFPHHHGEAEPPAIKVPFDPTE